MERREREREREEGRESEREVTGAVSLGSVFGYLLI